VGDSHEGWEALELDPERVRVGFCRKAAQRLLKRTGVTTPPVPVHGVAEKLSFVMRVVDLPSGVDARLRIAKGVKTIELASGQSRVRHRFSIAHELGHTSLGHRHGESDVAEKEAQLFAGALLVPRVWLSRDLREAAVAADLARRYEVSRDVIFIAAKEARLLDRLK
jgi:hypothetical protein